MKNILILIGIIVSAMSSHLNAQISPSTNLELSGKRIIWKREAFVCSDQFGQKISPCKRYSTGEISSGDSGIFGGELCVASQLESCESVARAQGENGRWWRSSGLVGDENHNGGETYSSDQALGALMYLTQTGDLAAANKWVSYMNSISGLQIKNPQDVIEEGAKVILEDLVTSIAVAADVLRTYGICVRDLFTTDMLRKGASGNWCLGLKISSAVRFLQSHSQSCSSPPSLSAWYKA